MISGSVTMIGSLTSLGLLAPKGLAVALEEVDALSPLDQFDLARVFRPLVHDLPGVSLPARKLSAGLAVEKWRATAQQLKNVPAGLFFAAVEKSHAHGAAWLYDLENLEETESVRQLYEKHRTPLEEHRDLEDPVHRFARKGALCMKDPSSKMWIQWVTLLSQSPQILVEETMAVLEDKIRSFPGSAEMLQDLRGRLALGLRDSIAMSEKKKVFRFSKRISFVSEAYLEVLEGRPVQGPFFRMFEFFLKFVTLRVLEKELQEHRKTLRTVAGEERLRLVADWKRRFSPALDDFEIDFRKKQILVPKMFQGSGRLETIRVEATDEEILNALPLSHRGILRTILRVLDEAKDKTGMNFLTDVGEAFYVKISRGGEKTKMEGEKLFEKLSQILAELFHAQARGDLRFRKPARVLKHVTNIYPFWIEETVRLAANRGTDPRLEKALIRWRYYFYNLLPDDMKDPVQFDRMNRGASSLSKLVRKTDLGRHLFVSRHLVELLCADPLLETDEFLRRLESLPLGENVYASLYLRGQASDPHEPTEEEVAKRERREEQRRLRAEIEAERQRVRELAAAAAREHLAEQLRVREEERTASESARLEAEAAARTAREVAAATAAQGRQENAERQRRAGWKIVVRAQEASLLSLLAAIEALPGWRKFLSVSNGFRTPEEILADFEKICQGLEEAMHLPLSEQHAADPYAKGAKKLVEEVRGMKRSLKMAGDEVEI